MNELDDDVINRNLEKMQQRKYVIYLAHDVFIAGYTLYLRSINSYHYVYREIDKCNLKFDRVINTDDKTKTKYVINNIEYWGFDNEKMFNILKDSTLSAISVIKLIYWERTREYLSITLTSLDDINKVAEVIRCSNINLTAFIYHFTRDNLKYIIDDRLDNKIKNMILSCEDEFYNNEELLKQININRSKFLFDMFYVTHNRVNAIENKKYVNEWIESEETNDQKKKSEIQEPETKETIAVDNPIFWFNKKINPSCPYISKSGAILYQQKLYIKHIDIFTDDVIDLEFKNNNIYEIIYVKDDKSKTIDFKIGKFLYKNFVKLDIFEKTEFYKRMCHFNNNHQIDIIDLSFFDMNIIDAINCLRYMNNEQYSLINCIKCLKLFDNESIIEKNIDDESLMNCVLKYIDEFDYINYVIKHHNLDIERYFYSKGLINLVMPNK